MDLKKNYDKALLVAGGILAIAGSGLLMTNAASFKSQFTVEEKPTKNELSPLNIGLADAAVKQLETGPAAWQRPKLGQHKTVSLFASTPFLLQKDKPEPVDLLADSSTPVRAPVENWWFFTNDLDITSVDILKQDPDRDGFTNEDEFREQTNPNTSVSKPTWISKLYYTERVADPLTLRLTTFDATGGVCGLRVTGGSDGKNQKGYFKKVGEKFADPRTPAVERFKILEVKQEMVKTKFGDNLTPVAIVEDLIDKDENKLRLVQGQDTERPSYSARMFYALDNDNGARKKGEEWALRNPAGQSITLKDILPDHVVVEYYDPKNPTTPVTKKIDLKDPSK